MNFGRNVGSWLAITAVAALGTLAAATTQGCTVTTGGPINDDGGFDFDSNVPPKDGGTDTATPDTGPDPGTVCATCAENACTSNAAACEADPGCKAIRTCTKDLTTCINEQPGASRKVYYQLGKCEVGAICGSCGSSCSTLTPTACGDAGPVCGQCVFVVCNAEQTACATGTDCAAYIACVEAAQDATALAKCDTDHPSGKEANGKLAACSGSFCSDECTQ